MDCKVLDEVSTVRTLIFVRGLTGVRSDPRPASLALLAPRMARYENSNKFTVKLLWCHPEALGAPATLTDAR